MANLTENKLISFQLAPQKKSRFQKAKEEEQLKKIQDEEAAKKALEDFTYSFVDNSSSSSSSNGRNGRKAFVKSGESYTHQPVASDLNKLLLEIKVGGLG